MALSLSLVVFILYVRFFAPKPPVNQTMPEPAKQEAVTAKTGEPITKAIHPEAVAGGIEQAAKGKIIVVETDLVKAEVNTAGGVITRWELKHYREADKTEHGLGVLYAKIMGREKKEETPKKAARRCSAHSHL